MCCKMLLPLLCHFTEPFCSTSQRIMVPKMQMHQCLATQIQKFGCYHLLFTGHCLQLPFLFFSCRDFQVEARMLSKRRIDEMHKQLMVGSNLLSFLLVVSIGLNFLSSWSFQRRRIFRISQSYLFRLPPHSIRSVPRYPYPRKIHKT